MDSVGTNAGAETLSELFADPVMEEVYVLIDDVFGMNSPDLGLRDVVVVVELCLLETVAVMVLRLEYCVVIFE